jgi:hypothetical protein
MEKIDKKFISNPILDRLIEVGTKALRRGLMSGETLRAPRQQLRWFSPPPSIFVSTSLPQLMQKFRFTDFLTRVRICRCLCADIFQFVAESHFPEPWAIA